MSATERIRAMLDERGVEYDTDDEDGCEFTEWVANGLEWEADSRGELVSLMPVMLITPEQAIAATLGATDAKPTQVESSGTCEADETDLVPFVRADSDECKVDYIHVMECTECGHVYEHVNGDYEYCPRCGRKRRDVEE